MKVRVSGELMEVRRSDDGKMLFGGILQGDRVVNFYGFVDNIGESMLEEARLAPIEAEGIVKVNKKGDGLSFNVQGYTIAAEAAPKSNGRGVRAVG